MKYTAFMVDIVKSKKLSKENREEVQYYIKRCLEVLNRVFRPSLEFDVIFSAGDEFQGLFHDPSSAVLYYRLLKMILAPLDIRCGIGVGEWDVKIENGTSSEQDGSAYHNAREAIQLAHNTSGSYIVLNAKSENDLYINTLLNASYLLMQKQSMYQNQVHLLIELMLPLVDNNSMRLDMLKEILPLMQDKEKLDFYTYSNTKKNNVIQNIYNATFDSEPINILSEYIVKEKMLLEPSIKKGISTKIAGITDTTRQNIDNVIASANILAIRNIDLTALIFIHRNYAR